MKKIGCDDRVGYSRFIFQADKNKTFRGSRTLACDYAASNAKTLAAGNVTEFAGPANAHGIEPLAAISHRMWSNGEASTVEVGNQALFVVHRMERGRRIGFGQIFEQRPGAADRPFHLPESIATVKARFRVSSFRFPVSTHGNSFRFS